ncbi:exodeoxyribonuclease VII large subunit [Fretibacter rubidus]|uniref:exodeoxyribonuclease VII large subunit n=1 Tax=Fretibacter rubidus TaxID=570162 RepID=UPI00352BA320
MSDTLSDNAASNVHEYSVSELAGTLKRTIEDTFGYVRVRGELGRVTIAKSGHCYLDIKDDRAVINSIIWKGQMNGLTMRPEEGMEVICEGKMTTYPGRSNYQLVISKMELAGAGALMALFEKRKKMLAGEGLFSEDSKRALPFMPKVIGVVTSPTGAVIRDILHRIEDRFPVNVILWPVVVQGDRAAGEIAAAITGFNHADGFPRPDVLIVGRGGGSLEDLWCFNEENVVRAIAGSKIPVISAVGHETDWTLSDYAADHRAPTPTGAAEAAVPVRADWLVTIADYGVRLTRGLKRNVSERQSRLSAARLPRLDAVLASPQQRLDLATARLPNAAQLFAPQSQRLALARMPALKQLTDPLRARLSRWADRLPSALNVNLARSQSRLERAVPRLRVKPLEADLTRKSERLDTLGGTASRAMTRHIDIQSARLERAGKLLEALSYQSVLSRGFAVVTDDAGHVVKQGKGLKAGEAVSLRFADVERAAVIAGKATLKGKKPTKPAVKPSDKKQADLF